jgi:hypothetical protein
MTRRSFTEHLAHLESLVDLRPGERVVVEQSGRTGTLVRRCTPRRDGWIVRWDEPMFGVAEGRVATQNLARLSEGGEV